jgi:hypothetical protein
MEELTTQTSTEMLGMKGVVGSAEVLKFVRHGDIDDHLRVGWMPTGIDGGLVGTYHGQWAILMQWICGCPVCIPQGSLQ